MSAKNDARQAGQPSPALDALPLRPAEKATTPRATRSFTKLLRFARAPEGPMADFPSEKKPGMNWLNITGLLFVIAAVLAGAFVFVPKWRALAAAPQTGQLVIISQPPGGEITVDGQRSGVTPLTLSLPIGPHSVQLNRANVAKSISVNVKAGVESTHYVDLEAQPAVEFGQLLVTSDPPGARVSVDGQSHGVTPVSIADVSAGQHAVLLKNEAGQVQRIVTIERGQTASLVVSMSPQAAFGWVTISTPVVMQVLEDDHKLGTTETDRIMLSAGRHTLKIFNTRLGFQTSRLVQVPAGGAATVKIDIPNGAVNLNALPWAEAFIDGRRVGETPIANIKLPIGEHEVVFRHPQLGERRQTFVVTAGEPARVALDLRK